MSSSVFLDEYDKIIEERASMAGGVGIPPQPLDAGQTSQVIAELKEGPNERLEELLVHRIPPGVDDAAYVKATWLSALAAGKETNESISRARAVELLGTMQGGYNVATLVECLSDSDAAIADLAADQLCHTLLVFDAFTTSMCLPSREMLMP
jgi:aconitate hydratase 2/2-methylisocitrate dehydratase